MRNPTGIAIRDAPLPRSYEAAKAALAECGRIDECKEWADRAQALASYARQADDDTLERMAKRIRARAVRRAGELLKTFQQPGARVDVEPRAGADPRFPQTQREAAEMAGLSKRQEKQAVRVANIDEAEFLQLVESEEPPTVTALAEAGKRVLQEAATRPGFSAATHAMGAMRRFAEKCREHPPELIAGGLVPNEHAEARHLVATIDAWLDRFIVNLRTEETA